MYAYGYGRSERRKEQKKNEQKESTLHTVYEDYLIFPLQPVAFCAFSQIIIKSFMPVRHKAKMDYHFFADASSYV